MSYLTCTNCGQKSPAEATRCKHCGQAFGRAPQRAGESPRSSIPIGILLAGAALIILAAYQLWPRVSVAPPVALPDTATVAALPPAPTPTPTATPALKESRAAPVESVRSVPAPPPSQPQAEPGPPAADTARPVARPAPDSVTIDVAHQRYVQTWANLRAERNSSAPVVRVLNPGEVVAVDSLQQGWYRIVTDSQAVGYVDQQYLDTLPPSRP